VWTRSGGVWTQQGSKLVGTVLLVAHPKALLFSISSDGNTAFVGGTTDNSVKGSMGVGTFGWSMDTARK